MSTGVIEIVFQAIQPIAIIPFILRLRCFIFLPIAFRVYRQPEVLPPRASPYTEFHLVVGVVGPGVV